MKDLMLIHKDDTDFIDLSKKLDYFRDEFDIEFSNTEDFLYSVLYKPCNPV